MVAADPFADRVLWVIDMFQRVSWRYLRAVKILRVPVLDLLTIGIALNGMIAKVKAIRLIYPFKVRSLHVKFARLDLEGVSAWDKNKVARATDLYPVAHALH